MTGRWVPPRQIAGWILVEDPGPWSAQAAEQSTLVSSGTQAAARLRNFRINLIRPHVPSRRNLGDWLLGRRPEESRARLLPARGFIATAPGGRGFVEAFDAADLGDGVAPLLGSASAGRATGIGVPVTQPLYLTCSNGRRNADCARRGRREAGHLLDLVPERSWETTHVGGCAGAANVVVLPTGIHYRQVTAEAVGEIVAATEEGRIALPWYHGCSAHRLDVQYADLAVRAATGLDRLDDVRLLRTCGPLPDGTRWVELATAEGPCRVVLRPSASGNWRQWDVVSVEQLPETSLAELYHCSGIPESTARTD